MRTVVFVGLRSGALDAAERLGLRVVAVVETQPGPRTRARLAALVEASFDRPEAFGAEVAEAVRRFAPAAVVALTERSVVPAAHLRAALGLPGLSVGAARRCTDKAEMKRAVRAAGLACADTLEAGADRVAERLGLPLVLKTRSGSGGRGTRVLRDASEVPERVPDGWLAESFVEGVEMSVEQMVHGGEAIFFNPTQYLIPAWASLMPAPFRPSEGKRLQAFADAARHALGVEHGMVHLELFLTPQGPVFGELAARPPGGYLMPMIRQAYGFEPWDAVLQMELGDRVRLRRTAVQTAAAWIVHPGAGTVRAVGDLRGARQMPGVEEAVLRVGVGDRVSARLGTGEEVGHILRTGSTASEVEARIQAARAVLQVEVVPGP